jgi:hypothetical protein
VPPAQRPQDARTACARDPRTPRRRGGVLRRLTVRALLTTTRALRDTADTLTRLRWRLEDGTARNRAVTAGHPRTRPRLGVVPGGYAQGRADLQLTHRAGHGASEGDPDL